MEKKSTGFSGILYKLAKYLHQGPVDYIRNKNTAASWVCTC